MIATLLPKAPAAAAAGKGKQAKKKQKQAQPQASRPSAPSGMRGLSLSAVPLSKIDGRAKRRSDAEHDKEKARNLQLKFKREHQWQQ